MERALKGQLQWLAGLAETVGRLTVLLLLEIGRLGRQLLARVLGAYWENCHGS